MSHTPGPWIVYEDWYIKSLNGIGSHATVCAPIGPKISDDEHRANARLIAASPDLMNALQKFVAWHDMDHEAMTGVEVQQAYDQAIDTAKAALFKATQPLASGGEA
jgi:hypothetical protein